MWTILVGDDFFPYIAAFGIVIALLGAEFIASYFGKSILASGWRATDHRNEGIISPELDDYELLGPEGGSTADLADYNVARFYNLPCAERSFQCLFKKSAGVVGLTRMPTLVWLASVLLTFGATGYLIQSMARVILDTPLNGTLASTSAALFAVAYIRMFGAQMMVDLTHISVPPLKPRPLEHRAGVVVSGSAERGKPAQVKVWDRFGKLHFLNAEPLRDDTTIEEGARVHVLRHKQKGDFVLIKCAN